MSLIDEFANREGITKAAVITRALDCMRASYDSGNGGMPVTGGAAGVSEQEFNELKEQLQRAESKAAEATRSIDAANDRAASAERSRDAAEARATDAVLARDAAEAKARETATELVSAQAKAGTVAASAATSAVDDEIVRLRELVAKQEVSLEEKAKALAAKEAEIAAKEAMIAERDARITSLSEQLGAANAKAQLVLNGNEVKAVTLDAAGSGDEDSTRALSMLNMLGGVMGAFQQQVDDARVVGEQEGRLAVQHELEDMMNKARNDGYRDAMTYLDNRVTTARESGAKEERARIANMSFFEQRRYLKVHFA